MARVSFTLRNEATNPDLGSYLRFDDTFEYVTSQPGGSVGAAASISRTNYDSALRADGLQIAPMEFDETYFEGESNCYGKVDLEWGVNITTVEATPVVTGVVLVYSPWGEPQTISAGNILVESTSTYEFLHTDVPTGKWAYYSLFVHYESTGGDDYYERAASLAVLPPVDHGSTLDLWDRIPSYYRYQDGQIGSVTNDECLGVNLPADSVVGPLFKFLSIIGFDMDRIRTIADHVMVSRDPLVANTPTLGAIGDMLGVPLETTDLGSQRMRTFLNDVGYFRRSKGTELGTEYFAQSVSGSDILIDQTNQEITLYSQRVNYVTVPKNGSGIVTHRAAGDVEQAEVSALDFSDTTYAPYSGSYSYSIPTFTTTGTGASAGVNSVMIHIDSVVPVQLGDSVGFTVHSGVGTSAIKWVRLVDAAENVVGFEDVPIGLAYEVGATANASTGIWTDTYVELLVDLSEVPSMDLSSLLAERNHLGEYFDGDTVRGGWLIDASSVSDYRWSGSANLSQSIFAEDYERSKSIIDELLFDVFPITEADDYTIVSYNAIPGI